MNWYLEALRKYATFSGRARRSEYWFFNLFLWIIFTVVITISAALQGVNKQIAGGIAVIGMIFILAMLIPSLAVAVRRLHDTNKSGWWLLIGLIPYLGGLVLLIFTVFDSEPGPNKWGPNPKVTKMA